MKFILNFIGSLHKFFNSIALPTSYEFCSTSNAYTFWYTIVSFAKHHTALGC